MRHRVDFLVLGSGAAGLSFALQVAERGSVAVITKQSAVESNTTYAQGGIAAVMDSADSIEKHVQDTLIAGAGLCDESVVRMIIEGGPQQIRQLVAGGATFSSQSGKLHLGREGGHTANRIVHAADAGLPPAYTIFGQVTNGMDTVDELANTPVRPSARGEASVPTETLRIQSIEITTGTR